MMTKHTFYVPPESIQGEVVAFSATDSNHATRVLRLEIGAVVTVVDGRGTRMHVKLMEVSRKRVLAVIQESWKEAPSLPAEVVVAAALLKSASRYETMLEKVAEIGARTIVPLITDRTEKSKFRADRGHTILVGAMKQCGSSFLTRLDPPATFADFVSKDPANAVRLACHEGADPARTVASALKGQAPDRGVILLIGPEGGFTDREMESAARSGFGPVSLGRARLRAETAAIVAVGAISQLRISQRKISQLKISQLKGPA